MSRVKIEPAEEVRLELTRPGRTTLFESVRLPFPARLQMACPERAERVERVRPGGIEPPVFWSATKCFIR